MQRPLAPALLQRETRPADAVPSQLCRSNIAPVGHLEAVKDLPPTYESDLRLVSSGRTLSQELHTEPPPAKPVEVEKFDWLKAWYPVAIERDLPTDRPTSVRLLGNAIVLWKDGYGQWRAFKDACPHRLVPLSEGRVDNGRLVCSLHGWQFGGDGRSTDIPQALNAKSLKTATTSRKSCCTAHPCQVNNGLVFVYGSSGAVAAEESRSIPVPVPPTLADGSAVSVTPWYQRDLPYGADLLAENTMDPAHVPWAHHGLRVHIGGDRNKAPKVDMTPAKEISPRGGFLLHNRYIQDDGPWPFDLGFQPPTLLRYQIVLGYELIVHSVPTDPSRCRLIGTVLAPTDKVKGILAFILKLKRSRWLLWFDHLHLNKIADGENVLLGLQDQELQRRRLENASKNYYLPTPADFGVRTLYLWLQRFAKPVPWGQAAVGRAGAADIPSHQRHRMLDRFEQHTQNCPSCAAAHKTFSVTQWAGAFAAAMGATYMACALGNNVPLRRLILPAIGTAVAAFVAYFSRDFRQQMEFADYRHADR